MYSGASRKLWAFVTVWTSNAHGIATSKNLMVQAIITK